MATKSGLTSCEVTRESCAERALFGISMTNVGSTTQDGCFVCECFDFVLVTAAVHGEDGCHTRAVERNRCSRRVTTWRAETPERVHHDHCGFHVDRISFPLRIAQNHAAPFCAPVLAMRSPGFVKQTIQYPSTQARCFVGLKGRKREVNK